MPQNEIIQLHIGQAGIQAGSACWELFCLEHAVQTDGLLYGPYARAGIQNGIQSKAFFRILPSGKNEPRCIMIDLEPTVIDEIRTGTYRNLFNQECLITGKEDAANNFARGMYSVGKEMLDLACDRVRKQFEDCDLPQGFIIYRSYGGGTGSGFTSILLERLRQDYNKFTVADFGVYPSPRLSPVIVEPYNTVFATHSALEYEDLSFLLDNEAVYGILERFLDVPRPTYTNINRVVAQVVGTFTASLRYDDGTSMSLQELNTNLVPYPRLHYPMLTYTPFIPVSKAFHEQASIAAMTNCCFEPANQLIKCDPRTGKYLCCNMLYRGDVNPLDINNAIFNVKSKKKNNFVDWCPTGFKVAINYTAPTCVPGGDMANVQRTVVMVSNNTAIKSTWENVAQKFKSMYKKRAFMHHYLEEGMEETEFDDALLDVKALVQDYYECEH